MRLLTSFVKRFKKLHHDQWAYEAAAREISSGHIRKGLILKAMAASAGDETKARSVYLKFLAEIIDEENAESDLHHRLKIADTAVTAGAKATTEAITGIARSACGSFKRWFEAFLTNSLIALGFGLQIGYALFSQSEMKSIVGDSFPESLGSALRLGLPSALTAILILAFLMISTFMRRHTFLALAIALVPSAFVVRDQWSTIQGSKRYEAQNIKSHQSPSAYDILLAQYEALYPQINPDSPQFSQALTERVRARMEQFVRGGHAPEESLRMAVSESLPRMARSAKNGIPSKGSSTPVQIEPSRSACEFKSVMTNDDYRACGIRPPVR